VRLGKPTAIISRSHKKGRLKEGKAKKTIPESKLLDGKKMAFSRGPEILKLPDQNRLISHNGLFP